MDLNCDIHSMPFSLESMSTVKVASQMLSVVHTDTLPWLSEHHYQSSCATAEENVAKLKLPRRLHRQIVKLMKPVSDQTRIWHHFVGHDSVPVWTPQGTLSIVTSIEGFEEKHIVRNPFFELPQSPLDDSDDDELPDLAEADIDGISALLEMADCIDVFGCYDPMLIHPRDRFCWEISVQRENCFFDDDEKVSSDNFTADELARFYFSPTTLIFKFKDNSISGMFFAHALLSALVYWPYQPKFLDVAESLANLLDGDHCWHILSRIAAKLVSGYKDCDYAELFISFWKLCAVQRSSLPIGRGPRRGVISNVLMTKDEGLIGFVFSELSDEDKTSLLADAFKNHVCYRLAEAEEFGLLERLVEFCGMRRVPLLQKFESDFQENLFRYIFAKYHKTLLNNKPTPKWSFRIKKVGRIVNEMIAVVDPPASLHIP